MPHFKWTAAALAVLISTAACDSAVSPHPKVPTMAIGGLDTSPWQLPVLPKPGKVVVALTTAELGVGQSAQASATAWTDDGDLVTGGTITWSSDDSSVATVDTDGLIRGVAAGSTRIVATIGGVTGAAVMNIMAAQPVPIVASVSVALTRTVVNSGETAEAVATARTAMGNVVAGQPVAWASSSPRVATVSSSGVVTAGSPGMASITATVGGVSGEATLSVATLDPPDFANNSPSPGHPNEPAGFVQLSPTLSGDTVPLAVFGPLAAYELGWVIRNTGEITQQIDNDVPFASKNVLNINFPSGMIGGGSPGMTWTAGSTNPQNWGAATPPHQPRQLYQSFWYKLSPNFPLNLVANKVLYTNNPVGGNQAGVEVNGSADYPMKPGGGVSFSPNQATPYTAGIFPVTCVGGMVQVDSPAITSYCLPMNVGVSGAPENWPDSAQIKRGRWYHFETLYTLNTAGQKDGGVKMWINGNLVSDWSNRLQWTAGATYWAWTSWTPVYGGGGSIPNDGVGGYHRLKDFYVSGK